MGVGYSEVANYTNTSSGTASGVTSYGGVGGVDEINSFFSALNWFLKGEPGAWYDPSDFQPNWRRNLLTYTEDFSNGVWPLLQSTIVNTSTLNPIGIAFSQKIIGNTSVNLHGTNLTVTPSIGVYTKSIYAKVAGYNWLLIQIACGGTNVSYSFNLSSGSIGTAYNIVGTSTATITSIGDGWYRCTLTGTAISATAGNIRYWVQSSDTNGYVAGDGTSGIYIWGAQLEQSSSASVYQKITDGVQDYYTVQPQPVLFQDSAGTTPVTAVEQPVGLMLDKSRGLALGAELVTNGNFSNGTTGWTGQNSASVTVSGGNLTVTPTISTGWATTTITTVVGITYTIVVSNLVGVSNSGYYNLRKADNVNATINNVDGVVNTNGRKQIIFTATATITYLILQVNGLGYITIDNISVKQIAGNHAFQGDMTTGAAAKRPMLSARVNLLTKTEDFSDASWLKGTGVNVATTSVVAPNGTLTVSKYYLSNLQTSGPTSQLSKGPFTGVANMKFSCYVKSAGATGFFVIQDGAGNGSTLDLSTWQISSNISNGIGTVIPLPDGWYRFTVTTTSTNPYFYSYFSMFTGDGVSGIYIWGADLRPTNAGALLPPYQRVNTASDYDTVGFPLYLKANGTSSAMSTNSIDFTATDKMTVVTGVRKLSALSELILELSADTNTSTGAFYLGTTAPNIINSASKGTVVANLVSPANYPNPVSFIETLQSVISQPLANLRLNGTQVATNSASQGASNFGNYPLYLFARTGTLYPFTGNFYGAIIRGAQSDTASVTQTENYMAQKTGITF